MTLKDVILGLLNRTDIINYLIILRKLCIWECRKAGNYPDFSMFLKKVQIKFETERYIANKNGTFVNFRKRWEAILAKSLKISVIFSPSLGAYCVCVCFCVTDNLR